MDRDDVRLRDTWILPNCSVLAQKTGYRRAAPVAQDFSRNSRAWPRRTHCTRVRLHQNFETTWRRRDFTHHHTQSILDTSELVWNPGPHRLGLFCGRDCLSFLSQQTIAAGSLYRAAAWLLGCRPQWII